MARRVRTPEALLAVNPVALGYRHIDTAHVYGTECNVGAMLSQQLLAGEISRDDVFVTTKVARARPDVKLILTPPCIFHW